MTALTIKLDDDIAERVRQYSEKSQTDINDVVAASVRKFLLLAELDDLQKNLSGKASVLGFDREEDLFDAIS